jgi:hypothetical protein
VEIWRTYQLSGEQAELDRASQLWAEYLSGSGFREPRHMRLSLQLYSVLFAGTMLLLGLAVADGQRVLTATLIVTSTADSGAGSLRQALADANNGDTIQFDAALNGQTITLISAELAIDKSITINGPGPTRLTVERSTAVGVPAFRIFHVMPGRTVMIKGLTIYHGLASLGGGVSNDHATLTLDNCTVTGNGSEYGNGGSGGGIYNYGEQGSATLGIVNSTISNNGSGYGGGIYNDGAILTITNSIVSNNAVFIFTGGFANLGSGAGIYNGGTLAIANSTLSDNHANRDGGGILNDGPLTITNSTVTGNSAGPTEGSGGGILNSGLVTITNSTLSHNQASASHDGMPLGSGGAISNSGNLEIMSSTLHDNGTTGYGGGIVSAGTGATLTIVNSTLSGNSANGYLTGGRGGAISNGGTLEIANSTLNGNSGNHGGGGIYNNGTLRIGNTILGASSGANIFNDSGTVTSSGYNLSSDNGGGLLTATGDQINTDPMLSALQDNGGSTLTHALLMDSPAINRGQPDFTPPPLYDQRGSGFPRVFNGRLDIGSVEAQPIGTTLIITTTADSGAGSLRDTIATASAGDTIEFAPGLSGQTITLTSDQLVIDKSLTIRGPGAGQLTLQRSTAGGTPAFRIFLIAPNRVVTIQGITISNGYAPSSTSTSRAGGGIYNSGTLTMSSCGVTGNRADFNGGGILNDYYGGVLTMDHCAVNGNSVGDGSIAGYGGGIYNGGLLTLTSCNVNGNTAIGGARGGGIYNASMTTVSDSTFSGNLGSYGGGIFNDQSTVSITNSTFSTNNVYSRGGGIYNGSGILKLAHTTLSGNSANSGGGGIYSDGSLCCGTLEIGNTIFNAGIDGANIVTNSGTVISHGYNLSSDNGGGALNGSGDQINTNPMLGPLQDNGGPTFTHELLSGSPAIDAGDPSFTPPPLDDQRGYARVFGNRIDIGSLEVQPVPIPTPTPTPTPTASPTPTPTPSPTATASPSAAPAQALNISTRLRVETGDRIAIGGFIITGSAPKRVAMRGIGPSLGGSGPSDVLPDPTLELRGSDGASLMQNDNWQDDPAQAAQLIALGLAPQNSNESGMVATLEPGAYTAILAGKNQSSGLGLVEVYDADTAAASQLANISTRGFVSTADNVMIGGFILGQGSGSAVAVRGLGPSLSQSGLSDVLADPSLELHDANGALLVANDNWQGDPVSAAQLTAHGLGLANPLESGIFATLSPGLFTAIMAGKNGSTGIGLVEIYSVH